MPNRRHSRLKLAPGCCAKAKNSCRKVMVEHSCQGMFSSSKGLHAIVNCVTHVYGHLLPMSPVYTVGEGRVRACCAPVASPLIPNPSPKGRREKVNYGCITYRNLRTNARRRSVEHDGSVRTGEGIREGRG